MNDKPVTYSLVEKDAWSSLRSFTAARIALGNTGGVIPLQEVLALKMAHAHARDAVYAQLNESGLVTELCKFGQPVLKASSCAKSREQYLLDPGLGRKLDTASIDEITGPFTPGGIAIIISDGLSARAVNTNAISLLEELIPGLINSNKAINSLWVMRQGRVAISDEVGEWCKAGMAIILLGERPGLTVSDSLGAYLTFGPKPGLTDESRNCVSNIHPGGLSYKSAAKKIVYLVDEAFRAGMTGIGIKDRESDSLKYEP